MPPRLERRHQTGNHHFVTFSCQDRRPYLAPTESKLIFLQALESRRVNYHFHLFGYVLMPEHVHLILSEPSTEPLSKALTSLKREVSRQHPQSPFWLPRYHDFNLFTSGAKRTEKLRYLHRNPVARGLTETPEAYPWSSFRAYAFGQQSTAKITFFT